MVFCFLTCYSGVWRLVGGLLWNYGVVGGGLEYGCDEGGVG